MKKTREQTLNHLDEIKQTARPINWFALLKYLFTEFLQGLIRMLWDAIMDIAPGVAMLAQMFAK